jgi:hypothetical protein
MLGLGTKVNEQKGVAMIGYPSTHSSVQQK